MKSKTILKDKKGNVLLLMIAIAFLIGSVFAFISAIKVKKIKDEQVLGLTSLKLSEAYYTNKLTNLAFEKILPYKMYSITIDFFNNSRFTLDRSSKCKDELPVPLIYSKDCSVDFGKKLVDYYENNLGLYLAEFPFASSQTKFQIIYDGKNNIQADFSQGVIISTILPRKLQGSVNVEENKFVNEEPIKASDIDVGFVPYCSVNFNQPQSNRNNKNKCLDRDFYGPVSKVFNEWKKSHGDELPQLLDINWLITIAMIESNCDPLVNGLGAFQVIEYGKKKFGANTQNPITTQFLQFKEKAKRDPDLLRKTLEEQTKYALETLAQKTRAIRSYAEKNKIILSPETELLLVLNAYNIGEGVISEAFIDFIKKYGQATGERSSLEVEYIELLDSLQISCETTWKDYKEKTGDDPCLRDGHNIKYVERALKAYAGLCEQVGGELTAVKLLSKTQFFVKSDIAIKKYVNVQGLRYLVEKLNKTSFENVENKAKEGQEAFLTRVDKQLKKINFSVGYDEKGVKALLYNYFTSLYYCMNNNITGCVCSPLNLNYLINVSDEEKDGATKLKYVKIFVNNRSIQTFVKFNVGSEENIFDIKHGFNETEKQIVIVDFENKIFNITSGNNSQLFNIEKDNAAVLWFRREDKRIVAETIFENVKINNAGPGQLNQVQNTNNAGGFPGLIQPYHSVSDNTYVAIQQAYTLREDKLCPLSIKQIPIYGKKTLQLGDLKQNVSVKAAIEFEPRYYFDKIDNQNYLTQGKDYFIWCDNNGLIIGINITNKDSYDLQSLKGFKITPEKNIATFLNSSQLPQEVKGVFSALPGFGTYNIDLFDSDVMILTNIGSLYNTKEWKSNFTYFNHDLYREYYNNSGTIFIIAPLTKNNKVLGQLSQAICGSGVNSEMMEIYLEILNSMNAFSIEPLFVD